MKELIAAKNKAYMAFVTAERHLKSYCRNSYYDLDDRFEVWEEEIIKRNVEHDVAFNPYSPNFTTPVPTSIGSFDSDGYPRGTTFTYEDLIAHVEGLIYESLDLDEVTEQDRKLAHTSTVMCILKEWLMVENFGSWRNVW